jgi:hypothetical protein
MADIEPLEQCRTIAAYLNSNKNSLPESLEIIANLLVRLGSNHIPELSRYDEIGADDTIEIVLKNRKKNGETVANATVLQGLTLLSWLRGD